MKINNIKYILTIFLISFTLFIKAQEIFPVNITGNVSLPMPHSFIISDYGGDNSSDIMLTMTLNDPVEAFRDVQFRVTIKNNNSEVIFTNPDFIPNTFRLEQFIPELVTGDDLAVYFDVNNMLSIYGGMPGDLLPDGFNSICIEVIDPDRGVPISNQFCSSGFFELNAPPLITIPVCNTAVEYQEIPNILFQWQPLHIGNPNAPAIVEYDFELVELPEYYDNVNDIFDFAIPIYQETVMAPTIIYTDAMPALTEGKSYAWRVRVFDAMNNLELFTNSGYSEVCMFELQDPSLFDPNSDGALCTGSPCDYDLTDVSLTPRNDNLAQGDEIQIGHFIMTLTEEPIYDFSASTFSGAGSIYISFINTNLSVTFEDLQINDDNIAFEGEVTTVEDEPTLIPAAFSDENMNALAGVTSGIKSFFSDQAAESLDNFLSDPLNAPTRMISNWKDAVVENAPTVGLPLGLDIEGDNTIAITAIVFSPTNANMNAVFSNRVSPIAPWAKFGIRGMCLRNNGPAMSDPQLVLLEEVDLEQVGLLPLTLEPFDEDGEGTYLSLDCNGFKEFSLVGRYDFDPADVISKTDGIDTVSATFATMAYSLSDFITTASINADFVISGLEDYPFSVGNLYLDYSIEENPEGIEFPESYGSNNEDWKGIYLASTNVGLPPIFQNSAGATTIPALQSNNVIIDANGLTGNITGYNLINANDGGAMGGWAYTLDSFYLNLEGNSFVNSGFTGGMRLPIMNEAESIPYEASIYEVSTDTTNSWDMVFNAKPDTVTIDLLKARIAFDEESVITVGRLNNEFQTPKAVLSGVINTTIGEGDSGFTQEIQDQIQEIEDALASVNIPSLIPNLSCDGIKFENMVLDAGAEDKFSIESIQPLNASLSLLGLQSSLDNINFADVPDSIPVVDIKKMDFKFKTKLGSDVLGAFAPVVTFTIKIEENALDINDLDYNFLGYDIDFDMPDINLSCTSSLAALDIDQTPADATVADKEWNNIKVGRFLMDTFTISSDNGNGLISGIGIINVPILGLFQNVNVEYTDITINNDGELMSGKITVASDSGIDPEDDGTLMSSIKAKLISSAPTFNLPVLIGESQENGLTILGLEFEPEKASISSKLIIDLGGGQYARFEASGLDIVPNGIASFETKIKLSEDFNYKPWNDDFPLAFAKYDEDEETGSFAICDCDGFQSFNLSGNVQLPTSMVQKIDSLGTSTNPIAVVGEFEILSTKWGEFMGTVSGFENFHITGVDDIPISFGTAYIDLSSTEDPESIVWPTDYPEEQEGDWKGFFIPSMSITLPEAINNTADGTLADIQGFNFLMDSLGVTGKVSAQNLISFDGGLLGGLPFSLDSLNIDISENSLANATFNGELRLPIMEEDEGMQYEATIIPTILASGESATNYNFTAVPETVSIDIMKSTFSFDSTSTITIGIEDGEFEYPVFDLSGSFKIDVSAEDGGFSGEAMSQIEDLEEILEGLGISDVVPELNLDSIVFSHMKFDLGAENKFTIQSITPENFEMDFLGMDWNLGDIDFGKYFGSDSTSTNNNNSNSGSSGLKKLAMSFNLGLSVPSLPIDLPLTFKMKLNELSTTVGGIEKTEYSFGGFELDFELPGLPEFNCDPVASLAFPTNQDASSDISVGQKIKVGAFEMKVTELETSSGAGAKGKGRIDIPFVGYTMNVSFASLTINTDGEVIGGEVITDTDVTLIPEELSDVDLNSGIPFLNPYTEGLQAKLSDVKDFMTLPISLKEKLNEAAGLDLPFDVVLMGLVFNAEGAQMNLSVAFPTDTEDEAGNDEYINFGARGLNIRPDGIDLGELQLFLAQDVSLSDLEMPLTIIKGDGTADGGSFITFSCDGFEELNLQAEYAFPRTQLLPAEPMSPDTVKARFEINSTGWGKFLAFAEIDSFKVVGGDDVIFNIDSAYVDYSDEVNPVNFPSEYQPTDEPVTEEWRGIYIKELSVELPPSMASFNNGSALSIAGTNIIYERGIGLTGTLEAYNLLTLDNGDLEGWSVSIDTFSLSVTSNSISDMLMNGLVHIPVTDEGDEMAYNAIFYKDSLDQSAAQFSLTVGGTYGIPFLENSTMILDSVSVVGIRYQDNNFEPHADITGSFAVTVGGGPFPKITLPKLEFQNFKLNDLDESSDAPAGVKTGGLDKMSIEAFSFAGKTYQVGGSGSGGSGGSQNFEDDRTSILDLLPPEEETNNTKMSGFPINISGISFESDTDGDIALKKIGFTLAVNFTGNGEDEDDDGGGLAAKGDVAIRGKLNFGMLTSEPWKAFEYHDVALTSLFVDAEVGPVSIEGGIKHYSQDPKWGTGYVGVIGMELDIQPSISVQVKAQFGTTNFNNNGVDYRYWFADAKAIFGSGIALGNVSLYGLSGGIAYHMEREAISSVPNIADGSTSSGPITETDALLAPGVSLSGVNYNPSVSTFLELKAGVTLGTARPEVFNADASFYIILGDTLGKIGVKRMGFEGSGYVMAGLDQESRDDAKLKVDLKLDFDFYSKEMNGLFKLYVNMYPYLKGNYPGGLAGSVWMHVNYGSNPKWWIKMGTPTTPISVTYYGFEGIEAYFMVGMELDDMNTFEEINPLLVFDPPIEQQPRDEAALSSGNGIAMGMKLSVPSQEINFLMFQAIFEAGAGFDVALTKYDSPPNCPAVGVDGWYLQGQMYAYVEAGLNIKIDTWIFTGRVNIFHVDGAIAFQAKLPNPTWMKGYLRGNYSALGGLVKGSVNFQAEFGDVINEACIPKQEWNPVSGIQIIANNYPNDDATDIPVNVQPKVSFNLPIDVEQVFSTKNLEGETLVKRMRLRLDHYNIYNESTNEQMLTYKEVTDYGNAGRVRAYDLLAGNQKFRADVQVSWEIKDASGNWSTYMHKGKIATDSLIYEFTTGPFPSQFDETFVAYQAPGHGQRNWTKNYAFGMLEFKNNGVHRFFDPSKFNYVVRIQGAKYPYRTMNGTINTDYPITYYPINHTDRTIYFDNINDGTVIKDKIYSATIVGIPKTGLEVNTIEDSIQLSTVSDLAQHDTTYIVMTIDRDLDQQTLETSEQYLYGFYFRTSKYNSLKDKIIASSSTIALSILDHELTYEYKSGGIDKIAVFGDADIVNASKDDVKRYRSNLNLHEGYDKYDLIRLNANIEIAPSYTNYSAWHDILEYNESADPAPVFMESWRGPHYNYYDLWNNQFQKYSMGQEGFDMLTYGSDSPTDDSHLFRNGFGFSIEHTLTWNGSDHITFPVLRQGEIDGSIRGGVYGMPGGTDLTFTNSIEHNFRLYTNMIKELKDQAGLRAQQIAQPYSSWPLDNFEVNPGESHLWNVLDVYYRFFGNTSTELITQLDNLPPVGPMKFRYKHMDTWRFARIDHKVTNNHALYYDFDMNFSSTN